MFRSRNSQRFLFQLLLAFSLFTLGTTLGLGISVAWLLDRQINAQTRALLDQGRRTTSALLNDKNVELQNLALLVVARPTLNQLLFDPSDPRKLSEYLENLLITSPGELIQVCDAGEPLAAAGIELNQALCQLSIPDPLIVLDDKAWLISSAVLQDGESPGIRVLVGQQVQTVLEEFKNQSGLEYVLIGTDRTPLAASFDQAEMPPQNLLAKLSNDETFSFEAGNTNSRSYIAAILPLTDADGNTVELVSCLDIAEFLANSQQFRNLILVALLAVVLVGALLAVVVSQRISQPLNQLAQSASALRGGDLKTPLSVTSKVWEINQLTNALEDARVSLMHSLDQLQREKTWIENLTNSIIEGLLTLDEQSRITFASDSIERIIGTDSAMILGRSIDDYLLPPAGEQVFSSQLPDAGQTRRIPVLIKGRETILSVSASDFVPPEAGNANLALVIRDVSDEERIHRLMGEFMANITHEFRTPLAALAASVELLVEQLPDLSTPEIEQLLHSLNIGIINLQSLIDNLLEAASIEAGRFRVNPHPVDLNSLIGEAIATIRPISKKYGLTIQYPTAQASVRVLADQRRTIQALVNLLSNAIKHSPENGVIEVTTLIVGQQALIEVSDQGAGVPAERQKILFHRFARGGGENGSGAQGFGLGLSVVKAIIEAQHGEVGFKQQETGGARFWFTLPLAKVAAE